MNREPQDRTDGRPAELHLAEEDGRESFFRAEALAHYERSMEVTGEPLRITPAWVEWSWRAAILGFLAFVLFLVLGTMAEVAAGPAVVYAEGWSDLAVDNAGLVESVDVRVGDRVAARQVLMRLAVPTSSPRPREVYLRAPHAGRIVSLRTEPGRNVEAGQYLVTLEREARALTLVAILPGQHRPLLRLGQPLRLYLDGYEQSPQSLVVDAIEDRVVAAAEVERYLGHRSLGLTPPANAVVLVRARLNEPGFLSGNRQLPYYDGLRGRAEVRIRRERLLFHLVPGLKAWLDG